MGEEGTVGIALNLESKNVGVVLIGEGSSVRSTGKIAQVPVGDRFLGRIVNPLAIPFDGRGDITSSDTRLIEAPAPGIISRRSVCEPLQTGLVSVDALIPVGRGQRELIIGDRQTGKTAVALRSMCNQSVSGGGVTCCIYVAIGQKASSVAQVVYTLEGRGAISRSIVV